MHQMLSRQLQLYLTAERVSLTDNLPGDNGSDELSDANEDESNGGDDSAQEEGKRDVRVENLSGRRLSVDSAPAQRMLHSNAMRLTLPVNR